MDYQVFEEHQSSRGFTKLHRILLRIDSEYNSIADYLTSLKTEELMSMIDIPDSLGRTPLAWAVEYGLTASVELLLTFGADPNQLRFTKDDGFSPLIHLAIAGPRSAWMDADIVETVRLLVLAGADLNGTDHEGWTPLHIAASWSLFSITDMLRQCGQNFLNWQARTVTGESIFDVCDNIDYQNRYWGMLECPTRLI
jgi:ankyrin repeat protein